MDTSTALISNLSTMRAAFTERAVNSRLEVECPMDGTFFSDKVIIAEAPGEREVQQKLPLVGGSGSLLWNIMLKRNKLSRKDFYITNVIKRQVSLADRKKGVNKHELGLWTELLRWELGHLPNVHYILAMGNYALEALTGHTGITSWRGSVVSVDIPDFIRGGTRSVRVVVCNNAAAAIHDPRLEVVLNRDIACLGRVLNGSHTPYEISTEIYPSIQRIDNFLDDAIRSGDTIGHDIESISGETACFGFADTPTTAICIALRTQTDQVYSIEEERHIRRRLQRFYDHQAEKPQLLAQNGMFDMTWQWYKDKLRIPRLLRDTMLGHHTLYPVLPHNLGFLTTQYTDNPYYKGEKDEWRDDGDIDDFWRYNGKDSANLIAIDNRMVGELKDQGLWDFFMNHVMRLQPHLVRMCVGGLKMDMKMKEELNLTVGETVAKLLMEFQHKIVDTLGEELWYNPASPKQMSELYFSKLKLVGRGTSTDKENRDRMFKHPRTSEAAREIINLHNRWAEESKFYGTYVKAAADEDGRFRCTYNQTGTQEAPGRLSSSQTLWGSGGNLQNQPQRAYPMYVADAGYGFGYFDLSQAEARYVGWAANIEKWIEQFERARLVGGYDAHRALASDLFKIPYDEVPSFDHYDSSKPGKLPPEGKRDGDVTIRYIAKRCRHGLNYRMGPDRLATTAKLSLIVADKAYRDYHRLTPELRVWWASLETELKRNGCLYNAYGRRFILMERPSPEALESIVAFKPQSTIGDKVCRVIYMSEDHPRWPRRARVALNIHDAVICLAPLVDLEQCLSILKYYAEEPLMVGGRELIIPADCKISYPDDQGVHRWSQLKPIQVESVSM